MAFIKDIFKKHLLTSISAIVALLAFAVYFFPLDGMIADLNAQLTARAQANTALTGLIHTQHFLPSVNADPPGPLPTFPSQAVIDWGVALSKQISVRSAALAKQVEKISEDTRGKPDADAALLQDSTRFRDLYDRELRFPPADPADKSNFGVLMNAGAPPNDKDIEARAQEILKADADTQPIAPGATPTPPTEDQNKQARADALTQLRAERAKSISIYLIPDRSLFYDPAIATNIAKGSLPDTPTRWRAQNQLWIESDVCSSIKQLNSDKSGPINVTASMVKRLVTIDIPDTYSLPSVASDQAKRDKADLASSPTGRISGPLYDVKHFELIVDVDAGSLREFLGRFNDGRLMNVLTVHDVSPIDRTKALEAGYDFGPNPVVQVSLRCEALFVKPWEDTLINDFKEADDQKTIKNLINPNAKPPTP